MLTKNDLQQIRVIVDESIDEKLDKKFDTKLKPIKKQLNKMQKDLDTVIVHFDGRLTKVEHDVEELQQL